MRRHNETSRAEDRRRRAIRGGVTSVGSRIINIVAGLITIPLAVGTLGPKEFGVYVATAAGLLIMQQFLDLGMAKGAVTPIARACAHDDLRQVRVVITNLLVAVAAVASLGIATIFVAQAVWPNVWTTVLGISTPSQSARAAVLAGLIIGLVDLPLQVATSVRLGLQESSSAGLCSATAGVFQIAGVSVAAAAGGSLVWFVVAYTAAYPGADVLNTAVLFLRRRRIYAPRLGLIDLTAMRLLLRRGALFLALGCAAAIGYQTDTIVISHVLGQASVSRYAVAARLFGLVVGLVAFYLTPLWPAYGDARARGDWTWIRRTLARSIKLAFLLNAAGGAVLLVSGRWIVGLWVGGALRPPVGLLVALFFYCVVMGVSGAIAMYLNGQGIVGFQVAVALTMALVNLPLSVYLVHTIGIAGPVFGTVIAQTLTTLIPYTVFLRRQFGTSSRGSIRSVAPLQS